MKYLLCYKGSFPDIHTHILYLGILHDEHIPLPDEFTFGLEADGRQPLQPLAQILKTVNFGN